MEGARARLPPPCVQPWGNIQDPPTQGHRVQGPRIPTGSCYPVCGDGRCQGPRIPGRPIPSGLGSDSMMTLVLLLPKRGSRRPGCEAAVNTRAIAPAPGRGGWAGRGWTGEGGLFRWRWGHSRLRISGYVRVGAGRGRGGGRLVPPGNASWSPDRRICFVASYQTIGCEVTGHGRIYRCQQSRNEKRNFVNWENNGALYDCAILNIPACRGVTDGGGGRGYPDPRTFYNRGVRPARKFRVFFVFFLKCLWKIA